MTNVSQINHISKSNILSVVDQVLNDLPILKEKLKKTLDDEALDCQLALLECIKFMTLAGATPASLTPSLKIDLIWHEFILFTKYYATFCEKNFGKFLHHMPDSDRKKNLRQFRKTLGLYSLYFGEPPVEYWGETNITGDPKVSCGSCKSF